MTAATAPSSIRTGVGAAGPVTLAAAGALFLIYPVTRPWGDAAEATAAAAFASPAWLVAHLAAVAGFVLVGFALLALRDRLVSTPAAGLARIALGTWWSGTAMVLPYYGAEGFALQAIGQHAVATGDPAPLALVELIRMGPVQVTLFGAGLLVLALAAVLAAIAVARSGMLARLSGVAFAAGFVLFLPQFYAAPALRIAHGVLVAAGCVVLAVQMRRSATR
jgi:hypothetical protein